jgi:hypothetical protein
MLGAPKSGSYVPPSVRNKGAGGEGESMMRKREDNSVRVTNLSEDVSENDLHVSCGGPAGVKQGSAIFGGEGRRFRYSQAAFCMGSSVYS